MRKELAYWLRALAQRLDPQQREEPVHSWKIKKSTDNSDYNILDLTIRGAPWFCWPRKDIADGVYEFWPIPTDDVCFRGCWEETKGVYK